jgi:hypothetical protein
VDRAVDALAAAGKPTASPDRQTLSALERSGAKPGEALMVAECDMVLIMFGQCQGVRLREGLKDLSPRKLRMVRDLIKTCAEDIAEVEPSA